MTGKNMALDAINELFSISFAHSADNFSKMLRCKVVYSHASMINTISDLDIEEKYKTDVVQLIKTDIIGIEDGEGYLIFDKDQVDSIYPADSNSTMLENGISKVQLEFIDEVCNILSASVIKVLAEHLDMMLYGGPPIHSAVILHDYLEEIYNSRDNESGNYFVISFKISVGDSIVKPLFIWSFPDAFINNIEKRYQEKGLEFINIPAL